MAKAYNRTVRVYIDGSEIENTIPSIQKKVRELTRDIKKMTIGTKEYEDTAGSIAKLNKILSDHKKALRSTSDEARNFTSQLSRGAEFMNKWYYSAQTSLQLLTGIKDSFRKYIDDFARMEESMANVRKYTGQTDNEVRKMNEDFKGMDTRTAREQLNDLAGAAGRLGITSKDMIEEFVDGADKINVALGDDLGDGAVDKIGKLAHMFGEDKTKGLRGAMLATGSAVNDLAQTSSANAGYIVDFTADLSGVAIQAGFSQTQIMGLASALDQNMQEEATASTVFSQLITKMYQEPARFAAIAGADVKEFSDLLKKDANAALLQFLEAMRATGGFDKMAPLFEEMKLDGTRAVGVLSSVASHLDQVREAQKTANDAYAEGTSVLDEFNVQNNTVQAKLDKAKKQFADLSSELGGQLLPLVEKGLSLGSLFIKFISSAVSFVTQNASLLAVLTTAIAYYNIVLNVSIIKEKALIEVKKISHGLDLAIIATKTLLRSALVALQAAWALVTKGVEGYNVVMRAAKIASLTNPWAALATVLTVVGVAVYSVVKAVKAHNEAMKNSIQSIKEANAVASMHKTINDSVAESTVNEKTRIEQLNNIIHSNVFSVNQRRGAIEALQKIVPDYHAKISKEGRLYDDNTNAIRKYIDALDDAAMAKAVFDQEVKVNAELLKVRMRKNKVKFSLDSVDAEVARHPKKYESRPYTYRDPDTGAIVEEGEGNPDAARKQRERAIHQRRYDEARSREKVLLTMKEDLKKTVVSDKKLKNAYGRIVENGQHGANTVANGNAGGTVTNSGRSGRGGQNEETERRKKVEEELNRITAEYENKRSAIKEQYLKGEISTEQEYNKSIEDLEYEELEKKLDIANLEPKQKAEIRKKILDIRMQLYDKIKDLDSKFDATEEDRHNNELAALKEQYEEDQRLLDDARSKKLVTEEEYQKKLKKLKEKYDADLQKADKESAERIIKAEKDKFNAILDAQRRANVKAGKLDEQSQGERAKLWKEYLEKLLAGTKLNAGQRAEIEREMEDAETDETEKELERRKRLYEEYYNAVMDMSSQFGEELGEFLGNLFSGQKASIKDFLKSILVMTLDALQKMMVAAIAESTIKNIAKYGLKGILKAAGEIALVTAAFQTAKTVIDNFDVGGFTPEGPWDKPQGIVHSNEFVANRFAVSNPNVLPVLNLIDAAQRSGSVSRLTADDISAVIPSPRYSRGYVVGGNADTGTVAYPDNAALVQVLSKIVKSLDCIDRRFSQPIVAETYATGKHGTIEAENLVQKMKSNVRRNRK